jgi:CheY-like chemotaxis protein
MAKNILVVDDEKSYVKAFVRLFTRAGYDVVTAVTGVDAMNKIGRAHV